MAVITPTPRAGSWIRVDVALVPLNPRAGSWLGIEGSLSSTPRAGTWLRIIGQPGNGTPRAGSWIRVDDLSLPIVYGGLHTGIPFGDTADHGLHLV